MRLGINKTMPTQNIPQTEIVSTLYKYAEEYSIEKWPSEHRNHLGISIIGESCSRKIWYSFRWVKLIQHDPRMRRLFQRGHKEEPHFEEFLLWAGIKIQTIDPRTSKQYKLSGVGGHYGGSTDGIGIISWSNNLPIIVEFKTHNKRLFTILKDKKVKIAQPKHFAQMSGYGKGFEVKYGLYCAVNKDDDEWYFEFVELDWNYAHQLEMKASDIINSKLPPARISDTPSYSDCVYCDYSAICHQGEKVEINCRSCKMAEAIENGEWKCNRFGQTIPKDWIAKGCPEHLSVNV